MNTKKGEWIPVTEDLIISLRHFCEKRLKVAGVVVPRAYWDAKQQCFTWDKGERVLYWENLEDGFPVFVWREARRARIR